MTKCKSCGGVNTNIQTVAKFDASGLLGSPFKVFMHNAVKEKVCADCGEVLGHIVPMPEKLIAVAAIVRACDARKLNGDEIKFLRKSLCLKSKILAERLGVSPEQFSRFENNKIVISEVYEKLLRGEVCLHHLENVQHIDVDIRDVIGMSIKSAYSISKPFVLDLAPITVTDDQQVRKWQNQRQVA